MDREQVIEKVRKYKALVEEHLRIDSLYLYGSWAKGMGRQDSDIDVAIVMEKIPDEYYDTIVILWHLRQSLDPVIEPVLFQRGRGRSGFLGQIEKTGALIQ